MLLTNINDYVAGKQNLTKIEVVSEVDEYSTGFYVIKTKETYVFGSEDEADAKINEARQSSSFESAKKTYKAGKMNRAGEIVKPETYTVVIVLKY
jgi:hypothetical protein